MHGIKMLRNHTCHFVCDNLVVAMREDEDNRVTALERRYEEYWGTYVLLDW
jgi:hypothetical protein